MKAIFLCKRAQPNIDKEISFPSSRFKDANEGNWKKLLRVVIFLKGSINNVLTLRADDTNTLTCYIGVELEFNIYMKSHTGAVFTMVKGEIISSSKNQKLNSQSSTESDLIGVDEKIAKVIWMNPFL